jgi:hypothetical protein
MSRILLCTIFPKWVTVVHFGGRFCTHKTLRLNLTMSYFSVFNIFSKFMFKNYQAIRSQFCQVAMLKELCQPKNDILFLLTTMFYKSSHRILREDVAILVTCGWSYHDKQQDSLGERPLQENPYDFIEMSRQICISQTEFKRAVPVSASFMTECISYRVTTGIGIKA